MTSTQRASGRSNERLSGSRLQSWLDANGFTAAGLENEIGMSRQSLQQIRLGRDVRLETARRILGGCRRLAHREVRMEEIFDLEPDRPAKRESRHGRPSPPPTSSRSTCTSANFSSTSR